MNKKESPCFSYPYCIILLSVLVLVVFRQTIRFDFISLDDNIFIYQNPFIQRGLTLSSIVWAWTADLTFATPHVEYWQPMTVMSRLLDIQFFGLNPAGHHLSNFILHWVNTLLVFALFSKITRDKLSALVVACLFGVHPLCVEAVAWVTARKDLLGGFFALLSLSAYAEFATGKKRRFYFYTFLFFLFSILSKPVLICLPLWLLLLDSWPLERFREKAVSGLIAEKTPFFIGSVCLALIVIFLPFDSGIQSTWSYGSTHTRWTYPLRFAEQFYRFFIPLNLNLYQSHDALPSTPRLLIAGSILFLLLMTLWTFTARKDKPFLWMGWLWFVFGVAPTMNSMWAANRFMYMPLLGLAVMTAYGLRQKKRIVGWLTALWIGVLCAVSFNQTSYWRNDFTLFPYCLKINPDNTKAHYVLGTRYYESGEWKNALSHFRAAFDVLDNPRARAGAAEWMVKTYLQMGDKESAAFYMEWIHELNAKDQNHADTE